REAGAHRPSGRRAVRTARARDQAPPPEGVAGRRRGGRLSASRSSVEPAVGRNLMMSPRPSFLYRALACALVLAAPPRGAAAADATDFLDRYSLTSGFRSGQPASIAIPRGGGEVLFLRSGPRDRVQSLWSFDPRTGSERELVTAAKLLGGAEETLSPEEKARRERLRLTA